MFFDCNDLWPAFNSHAIHFVVDSNFFPKHKTVYTKTEYILFSGMRWHNQHTSGSSSKINDRKLKQFSDLFAFVLFIYFIFFSLGFFGFLSYSFAPVWLTCLNPFMFNNNNNYVVCLGLSVQTRLPENILLLRSIVFFWIYRTWGQMYALVFVNHLGFFSSFYLSAPIHYFSSFIIF